MQTGLCCHGMIGTGSSHLAGPVGAGFAAQFEAPVSDAVTEIAAIQASDASAAAAVWSTLTLPLVLGFPGDLPVPTCLGEQQSAPTIRHPTLPAKLEGVFAPAAPLTHSGLFHQPDVLLDGDDGAARDPSSGPGVDDQSALEEGALSDRTAPVEPGRALPAEPEAPKSPGLLAVPTDPPSAGSSQVGSRVAVSPHKERGIAAADLAPGGRPDSTREGRPAVAAPPRSADQTTDPETVAARSVAASGKIGSLKMPPPRPPDAASDPDHGAAIRPAEGIGQAVPSEMPAAPNAGVALAATVSPRKEGRVTPDRPVAEAQTQAGATRQVQPQGVGPATDSTPSHGPERAFDGRSASADVEPASAFGQTVSRAERMWLGQQHPEFSVMIGTRPGAGWVDGRSPLPSTTVADTAPQGPGDKVEAEAAEASLSSALNGTTEAEDGWTGPENAPALPPFSPTAPPSLAVGSPPGPLSAGVVSQLAAGVEATLLQRPDGGVEIDLSPDELGGVRLSLEADARDPGRLVVHLVFDRPETMDLFRRHADQLAEAIRAAGYAEARLDFGQAGQDAKDGNRQGPAGDQVDATATTERATEPGPAPGRSIPLRPGMSVGLDLRL